MESLLKVNWFVAFAGIWAIANGILHDIFVIRQGRPFERDLIRLLVDGHILIFSGIIYLCCAAGIKEQQQLAYQISILITVFLLGYCALIFKLVPAFGMIIINLITLIWLIIRYPRLS